MNRYLLLSLAFLFVLAFFSNDRLHAQDKHFTQFYAAPLTLNPALTGAFNGKVRFASIYRDQWRSVLDQQAFNTFAASADLRMKVSERGPLRTDALGIGMVFFADRIPGPDMSTTQISISGAYHKSLDPRSRQFLTLGFQAGIAQRSVNYQNLTFSDQFDGVGSYDDLSAEQLPINTFSYPDFSVGLNYSYAPNPRTAFFIGAAMHHILEANVSFYSNDDPETALENTILFRRYSAQFSLQLPLGNAIQIVPRANVDIQGPHFIANAGTTLRFGLSPYNSLALHAGSWVRPVKNEKENFELETVVGMIGLELNNVLLGFSYDANLGSLMNDRIGMGAFELSVAYLGNYQNEVVLCPKF
jgi:type IX secretion system PorP/SprF family membrane protein